MTSYYKKILTGIVSLILLSGCGTTARPYLEVGAGVSIDSHSDWYLRGDRDWICDSPTAHFELGVELPKDWRVGYHHQSHWACGGPFNKRPETYQDEFIITKKFGGIK